MVESAWRHVRSIIIWSIVVFFVVNAFSWNPGWGGRNDKKPGREIERYFGWPACFYCDLWRSDHPHEIALAAYFSPIPLSQEMGIVYCELSFTALLLNLMLVICGSVVAIIFVLTDHGENQKWLKPVGGIALVLGVLILIFGSETSVYL